MKSHLNFLTIFWAITLLGGSWGLTQNVGIGTDIPAEKLHVAGKIRSDSLSGIDSSLIIADPAGTLHRLETPGDTSKVLRGDLSWGASSSGGGSGTAGGGTFYFPDGTNPITPITMIGSSSFPYTVPAGMNLYVTNLQNSVGFSTSTLNVNGITVLIGFSNRGEQDDMGRLQHPILLGAGDILDGKTSAAINGFLIPALVQPVTVDLMAGSYTVPPGKTLIVTSYCSNGGFSSYLQIDGVNVFEGFSLFRGEAARNSHLGQALFVGSGSILTVTHISPNLASVNGYLR